MPRTSTRARIGLDITRELARDELRHMFPIGSVVRTRLEHVSRSGMSRDIVPMGPDGENITTLVAEATGERTSPYRHAIRIPGCGMDMGFALVYTLSRALYGNGRFTCSGVQSYPGRCPSNDHVNEWRSPDWTPGRVHSDGGYALTHRWVS